MSLLLPSLLGQVKSFNIKSLCVHICLALFSNIWILNPNKSYLNPKSHEISPGFTGTWESSSTSPGSPPVTPPPLPAQGHAARPAWRGAPARCQRVKRGDPPTPGVWDSHGIFYEIFQWNIYIYYIYIFVIFHGIVPWIELGYFENTDVSGYVFYGI